MKKMKELSLFTCLLFLISTSNFAQFTTVNYDYERNWFNEGQPLPAEKSMVFKGMIPAEAEIVELSILSSKRSDELYKATWIKTNDNELSLLVPFKLRAANEYDFKINFFNILSEEDHQDLIIKLNTILTTYIEVNLTGDKSIKFIKKNKKILKEINEILTNELKSYRTKSMDWNPAFSELVTLKLEQLEKADLDKTYEKGDTAVTKTAVRNATREKLFNELIIQLEQEVAHILDAELFVLDNSRFVDNYITETKQNNLAINVGYGGVYLSGNWDDFTYGSSPYIGMSVPLGNSILGSKFLSNTSVTLGVFLNNFKDEKGNKVSGFIINRPIYAGLNHKLFKFIRVNAGATFLEGLNVSDIPGIEPTKNVMIRPYLGLSARVDLSIGLGK
jgi:hypothetical protein